MKVIGFNGSPRKGANTVTLIESVLKGAESKGAETHLVNLNELKMKGCQGCEACKEDLGKCVQKDDLSPLLEQMTECDAVVLGTPIYWYQVSGQFKMLVDRLYCFIGWDVNLETGEVTEKSAFPEGKKFVIVTSRADEENTKVLPELYDQIQNWLNIVPMAMRASSTEFVNHYGSMNDKNSAGNNAELIARAESIGESLVST